MKANITFHSYTLKKCQVLYVLWRLDKTQNILRPLKRKDNHNYLSAFTNLSHVSKHDSWCTTALHGWASLCCTTMWTSCMQTAVPSLLSLSSTHPAPPGHHRAPCWAACAMQQFSPAICFTHACIYMSILPPSPPSPSYPPRGPQVCSLHLPFFLPCK